MRTLNKLIAGLQLKRKSNFKNERAAQKNKRQNSKNSDLLLLLINSSKETDFLFI